MRHKNCSVSQSVSQSVLTYLKKSFLLSIIFAGIFSLTLLTGCGGETDKTPDITPPSSPSVSINNGDTSTTSISVTLTLSATDDVGVTAYYASETSTTPSASDSGWTTITSTTSYSDSVSFTLSGTYGTKTVYVWFRDTAGNVSASANDSITLTVVVSTWETKAPMPAPRTIAAGGVINGKFYVAGGQDSTGKVATLEVYDPATNTWETKAPMPTARGYMDVAEVNGLLYVMGGCCGWVSSDSDLMARTIEVYNPTTDTWTTKAQHPVGDADTAGAINGKIYVAKYTTTEVYDPATDTWASLSPMSIARENAAGGVINGKLYVAGGNNGTGELATLEALTPGLTETDITPPSSPSVSINNGDTSTTSTSATLNLSAADDVGVTAYYASETSTTPSASDSGWTTVTSTTSYSATVSFTLTGGSVGDNTKTVYVWFKDAAGNVSASANDSITLAVSDTTAPSSPSVSINNGDASTTSTSATLSLSATDDVGVTAYYASETSTTPSASATGWTTVTSTTSYSATVSFTLTGGSVGDNTKTVYVWFKDAAGNVSASANDSITLAVSDTTPPSSPSVTINNGDASTTSTSATLSLSATDDVGVTAYYASETSTTPSASDSGWTTITSTTSYSDSVSFTLSGTYGTKTVYVWFRDAAGNVSASVSSSISLGALPSAPIGISAYNAGGGKTTISWNSVSGASSYNIYWSISSSVTKTTGTQITGATSPYTHTGLTNGTTYYYVVTTVDSYGESSESIEVSAIPYYKMLKLPDTGQTGDYTTTFGEDSDYTINTPLYTDNGNGTITDNITGFIWQKEDDNTKRTWSDAGTYCDNLSLGGYDDWRLPSKKELMSIVNYGTYHPSINTTYFPNTNSSFYWSSTASAYVSTNAWFVHFGDGGVSSDAKSNLYYIRCIRGGQ